MSKVLVDRELLDRLMGCLKASSVLYEAAPKEMRALLDSQQDEQAPAQDEREVLPCPFCGGDAVTNNHADDCYFTVHEAARARAAVSADLSLVPAVLKAWNRRAQPAEAEGAVQCPASHPAECYAPGTQVVHASLVHGIVRQADQYHAALSAVTAERDRLREDRDSQQRVCIASMEKVSQLRAEVEGMRKAFMRMRNVAAGYSNCCEFDSANTRRLEREFEAADELFRSSAAMAAKEA